MNRKKYIEIRKKLNLKTKPFALVTHLFIDAVLLVTGLSSWIYLAESPLKFLSVLPIPILMFRCFSLMHDAVHGALSKNHSLNNLIGMISGAFCLLPYEPWKRVHITHHYWSGNVEKDPVMAIVTTFPKLPSWLQMGLSGLWKLWFPVLAISQHIVFWVTSTQVYLKEMRSVKLFLSLLFPIMVWATLAYVIPLIVLIPAVTIYLVVVEVVNLPHHLQLPQFYGETKIPLWEQHQIARSCVYPKWFSNLVVLNFNFHIEHHLFPDLPWYQLAEIHVHLKQELKERYNSDPKLAWIIKNRSRNLSEVVSDQFKEKDEKPSAA